MPFEAWPSLCPKSTENGAEACRTERTARDGLTCWMPFLHAWKPWTCQRFAHFHLARRSKGRLQMFVRKFMANAPVPKRWASTFELDLKSMTLRFHGAPKASHSSGTTLTANCQQPAMLIGPLRERAYSRPIIALPQRLLARVLSVLTPCTLNTARICKWSCKFCPTPGRFTVG